MSKGYDTVVVGAGLTGLVAARELSARGANVLVVEARDRLGGRLWTEHWAGVSLELGGDFVHWFHPHTHAELSRYGIPFRAPPMASRWLWRIGGRLDEDEFGARAERMERVFGEIFIDSRKCLPLPHVPLAERSMIEAIDALSVQDRLDALDLAEEDRDLANGFLAACCSAPCREAGLTTMMRWYALAGHSFRGMLETAGTYPIKTAELVDAIAGDTDAEILLSSPVDAVSQTRHSVSVILRSGARFEAASAIIAVPLNTLSRIAFDPVLPRGVEEAAVRGHAGRGLKAWIHVSDPEPFYFAAPDDEPINWIGAMYEVPDGQILVAFGSDADRLDLADHAAVAAELARIVGRDLGVRGIRVHDWVTEEYSRGTWSIPRPNQLSRNLEALQRPIGRVVIAGSDVASGWNRYMDGAIESGFSAARSVRGSVGSASGVAVA